MVALSYRLSNRLHDSLQLFDGSYDPALYQLQFRDNCGFELVEDILISIDVLDSVLRLGVISENVHLADDRVKDCGEMMSETCTRSE